MKTKLNRLLSLSLAVLMVFSMFITPVLAMDEDDTQTVAQIGDASYTSFADAMTAANNMSGAVEVEIYGEVEFTNGMELKGSYNSITFSGKSGGAKITINQSAGGDYLEAHNKTVVFNNLNLAKANPAWSGNSGHMGNYFSIQGGTITYNSCIFLNGACANTSTATYNDCTFKNSSEYGLWVYDDAIVTVNGGTIDSTKGIKVYSEGEDSVTSTLTVQNATFTENVTAKPAVAIGYAESITLIGNTYNNTTGVLELDSGSDADCEGVTFVAQDAQGNDISSTLTAVDRSNSNAACGVLVDGKIYTTVTTAAQDADEGDTVTLLYASNETVALPAGVTLNKNNYEADGITETSYVTIGSSQINMADPTETFISAEITGLNKEPAESSVVIKTYSGETLVATTTLEKSEYYNLETLGVKICLTGDSSSWNTVWEPDMPREDYVPDKNVLYVDGVKVSEAAVPMIKTGGEVSVNWTEVPGVKSVPKGGPVVGYTTATRIWGETWSNARESYVIKIYSGETLMGTSTLNPEVYTAFNGDVKVTWHISFDPSTDTDEYWIQEWTVAPSLTMQPDKVVLCVDGVDVSEGQIHLNGPDNLNKIVAVNTDSNGNIQGYYTSLAAALNSADDGDTINLISGTDVAISAAGEVTGGKTVTITGEAKFDWSKGWLFVGRGTNAGDGTLIFDDATITSDEASLKNGSYGIHVSAPEKDSTTKNTGKVIFKNSDIQLSYLANRSNVEVDGGKLTVYYGFWVGGRPASETPDGTDGTATMDIKNGAVVEVLNHNGMGIGHESNGLMNIDGATFKYTGTSLNVAEGSVITVSGASTIAATVTGSGWVYMNGVTLDADTKLIGAKVGFLNGENTIVGSTIDDGWFNVGIGNNNQAAVAAAFAEANGITLGDVTVNVSANAVIGSSGTDYAGWIGSAYSADKTQHKYTLNIDSSVATFGYLHVSSDGVLNVKGDVAEENKAYIASGYYTFYAGDFIVNGVATLDDVDTRVPYGKISVDNTGTGESAGTLNIKNCDEIVFAAEGNTNSALKWWNSGIVNIENSTVSARTPNITETGALNLVDSEFTANTTTITNAGAISMDTDSKITAADITGEGKIAIDAKNLAADQAVKVIDLSGSTSLEEKVTIENGLGVTVTYGVDGDVTVEKYAVAAIGTTCYETLAEAVEAAKAGDTIVMLADVVLNTCTTIDKTGITLNLNGYDITSSYDPYTIDVAKGGELTIIGEGTIDNTSAGSTTVRNYGKLTIGEEGKAGPTITRGTTTNGAGNSAVKNEEGSTLVINSGTFIGDARSIQSFGTTTINGGTFEKTVEAWAWNDGSKTWDSELTITGGTFKDTVATRSNDSSSFPDEAEISISGGTYSVDVTDLCATGKAAFKTADNTYEIKAADLAKAEITLEKTSYEYTGNAIEAKVTVKLYNQVVAAKYYTVTYKDNTKVGKATVTITAKAPYTGKTTATFEITCEHKDYDAGKVTTEATCTKEGVKTYTCKCGHTKTETIPAINHSWDEGKVTKEATYTTEGVKTYTCKNDSRHTKTESIPKLLASACDQSRENCPIGPYKDTNTTSWYHDSVHFVLAEGYMQGYGKGDTVTFQPNKAITRIEVITVLWNIEEQPVVECDLDFTDVGTKHWYLPQLRWAVENGIVEGYTDGSFRPNQAVTRQEIAAILYRYVTGKEDATATGALEKSGLKDVADVQKWAKGYMDWTYEQGLITGHDDDTLKPRDNTTRAEMAKILYRYLTENK